MSEATGTVPAGSTELWRDRKRYLWLIGLVVPSLAFLAIGLHAATGWGGWFWIGPVVILVIVPVVDLVAGLDRSNPPDDVIARLENDRYYRWITFAFLPVQYLGFAAAFWLIARGELTAADKIGLAVSIGCVGGIGINTAHELGHKREAVERWLSRIALAATGYGHFYVEHNRGHHMRVATREDPASARLGESFWAFWPRTVVGGLRSAWRLESRRLRLRRHSPWSWRNDILGAWAMSLALAAGLVAAFGVTVVPFLVLQAVVGFSLLEVVNYLEHYGLCRQRNQDGRYEKVGPRHSWNSDRVVTNVFLFQLQRYSDHHGNPLLRYQTLRSLDESPQLPAGYATMIVLALVPPLWRRVMDKRVAAHYGGDLSLANVQHRAAASESSARGPR